MFKRFPAVIKLLFLLVLLNTIIFWAYSCFSKPEKGPENVNSGAKLYQVNCSGCHLNGKNLIKADKPIIGSKMLKSKQGFKIFLNNPPQPMPNFKNITEKPVQLEALYNYVVSLMGK